MEPLTGYADLEDQRIAYQVIGDGPVDIVYTAGFWGSFDIEWEEPAHRLFFQQLASFSRLIRFDMRGTGASRSDPARRATPVGVVRRGDRSRDGCVGSAQAVVIAEGRLLRPLSSSPRLDPGASGP